MPWVFNVVGRRAGVAVNKAAIYDATTATDEAPLNNPRGNLARVRFHSDFDYPRIVTEITGTLTLPAVNGNSSYRNTITLAAHGQAGIPWVLGSVTVAGRRLPFTTSLPVISTFGGVDSWTGRHISLGANATHIIVNDFYEGHYFLRAASDGPHSLPYRLLITDELLDDPLPALTVATIMDATPDYVAFADGRFDTRYRYLRESTAATSFAIAAGPTLSAVLSGATSGARYTFSGINVQLYESSASASTPSNTATDVGVT